MVIKKFFIEQSSLPFLIFITWNSFLYQGQLYFGNAVPTSVSSYATMFGPSGEFLVANVEATQDAVVNGFIIYAATAGRVDIEVSSTN